MPNTEADSAPLHARTGPIARRLRVTLGFGLRPALARGLSALAGALLVASCAGSNSAEGNPESPPAVDEACGPEETRPSVPLRIGTYNVSLYRERDGALIDEVTAPDAAENEQLAAAIRVILRNEPDVMFLNEFDYDAGSVAIDAFCRQLNGAARALGVAGRADAPPAQPGDVFDADNPYTCVAFPSNTGLPSGVDLNNDGSVANVSGTADWAGDAHGYGEFEGQYGFALISRFPLAEETSRSFQTLIWDAMPGALNDIEWYDESARNALRLSSKNHVDMPIRLADDTFVHALLSHPTPPSFDGPEDRNGRRNHDEIRLWSEYITNAPMTASWLCDDSGTCGGLAADALFVVLGDLNSDPLDGDVPMGADAASIRQLTDHPAIQQITPPASDGAAEQSALQGGANATHEGPAAFDTADFSESVGNLRVDYVLPSLGIAVDNAWVDWPESSDPRFEEIGVYPYPVSDHRPVLVDAQIPHSRCPKVEE